MLLLRCALMKLLFALLLSAASAMAGDSPEFCGSHSKNMVSDEKNLPETFSLGEKDTSNGCVIVATATNVAWGVKINSVMYPSPTVVAGKVFVGGGEPGKGTFKCLDAHTGKVLWQYVEPYRDFPKEIQTGWKFMLGRITRNLGIVSTAAVEGDRVYFVNHRCELLCLDANNGKPVWKFDMWEYGIRPADACNGSPLIDGDMLYVVTSNGTDRDAQIPYYDDRPTPAPKHAEPHRARQTHRPPRRHRRRAANRAEHNARSMVNAVVRRCARTQTPLLRRR